MIDQSLRTIILADSNITALIATNGVYPQRLPQDVSKPCIAYRVMDGFSDLTASGTTALRRYTVDLTVFAETYGAMRELTDAVVNKFNGLSAVQGSDYIESSRVHNVVTDFEETLQLYSATIDITLLARGN